MMAEITTMFWDIGGVLLSNGWDRDLRRQAVEHFGLDWEEFEDRHELVAGAFDAGRITLEEYLNRTLFYRSRNFSKADFREFMFSHVTSNPDTLSLLGEVARTRKYLLAALNNESLELNLYRIERFGLRQYFTVFFSSCFLGLRKPDEAIYRTALYITQRDHSQCVLIDDRAINLECASLLGMHAIHYQSAAQLREELKNLGVDLASPTKNAG
jgi:putative hydrolase of the HAD superfamily